MDNNNSNINLIYSKLDKLDEKFDKKIDKLDNRLDKVDKELAIYNEQLTYHIEGVRQLKVTNEILKKYIDIELKKLEEDLEPIADHVKGLNNIKDGIIKFAQIISYIVTISATIIGIVYTVMGKL